MDTFRVVIGPERVQIRYNSKRNIRSNGFSEGSPGTLKLKLKNEKSGKSPDTKLHRQQVCGRKDVDEL